MLAAGVVAPSEVETGTASEVTATTARLAGRLNPGGGAKYFFEYGPAECTIGSEQLVWWLCATATTEEGPVEGVVQQAVGPIEVTGLKPSTTYRYWVFVYNKSGSERGEEATFTTTPPASPVSLPPVLTPPLLATTTPIPTPAPTLTVAITAVKARGGSLLVTVRTSLDGTVTISGDGLRRTTRTETPGSHQIAVALTKAGKKDRRRHRKIKLAVSLKAAGPQAVSASRTVRL